VKEEETDEPPRTSRAPTNKTILTPDPAHFPALGGASDSAVRFRTSPSPCWDGLLRMPQRSPRHIRLNVPGFLCPIQIVHPQDDISRVRPLNCEKGLCRALDATTGHHAADGASSQGFSPRTPSAVRSMSRDTAILLALLFSRKAGRLPLTRRRLRGRLSLTKAR